MAERLNRAYLALGSNIDPAHNLPATVGMLSRYGTVVAASSVWESAPVGFAAQANFLNAAVLLETTLTAEALRNDAIAAIEQELNRVRDPANVNAPRTIDIDIALFNRDVLQVGRRLVPDPDILDRDFLAVPLAELDPDYIHPEDGRTLAEIARETTGDASAMKMRSDVVLLEGSTGEATLSILVTGGAGYIGSHMVRQLVRAGREVVVVDNLDRGHREAVDPQAAFYRADIADVAELERILREHRVECVIHFAGLAYVGESVEQPDRYYRNNTGGTMRLLEAMDRAAVKRIVFSSTCATYGVPARLPIIESNPQLPISPYGRSKWFVEQILRDKAAADPEFGFTAFRYFNVAGCARDGSLGEDHHPETHLIPILLQAALGQRENVTVFGRDYPTPDGTCIRDYIHVEDICSAHLLAIEATQPGSANFYNLGTGRGYSVDEVIAAVRNVTARDIRVIYGPRRPGDPPSLFAAAELASSALGWRPETPALEDIVASAWKWFRTYSHGYRDT